MIDSTDSMPPEVTIEPADNGFMVRHYRRSSKKDEGGRTIRQVASTADEALGHARKILGGTGKAKAAKKKPIRDDGAPAEGASGESAFSPSTSPASRHSRGRARRRRPRTGGRR